MINDADPDPQHCLKPDKYGKRKRCGNERIENGREKDDASQKLRIMLKI